MSRNNKGKQFARMKQPCDFSAIRVDAREIGAFLVIALWTG
jgi:hypothetical protein